MRFEVAYWNVTGESAGLEIDTVNAMFEVPEFPSISRVSEIETPGFASSLRIVPVASLSVSVPLVTDESARRIVSFDS